MSRSSVLQLPGMKYDPPKEQKGRQLPYTLGTFYLTKLQWHYGTQPGVIEPRVLKNHSHIIP